MKRLWIYIGKIVFVLAWPFWIAYFRFKPNRSRVLFVSEGKVLLVKGWLGFGDWSMPGGGKKSDESDEKGACREVKEETGIHINETSLRRIGIYKHSKWAIKYNAVTFSVDISENPEAKPRFPEIVEARWFKIEDLKKLKLDDDTKYALKNYKPILQVELL